MDVPSWLIDKVLKRPKVKLARPARHTIGALLNQGQVE
jgi:hypothetical protein